MHVTSLSLSHWHTVLSPLLELKIKQIKSPSKDRSNYFSLFSFYQDCSSVAKSATQRFEKSLREREICSSMGFIKWICIIDVFWTRLLQFPPVRRQTKVSLQLIHECSSWAFHWFKQTTSYPFFPSFSSLADFTIFLITFKARLALRYIVEMLNLHKLVRSLRSFQN